MSPPPLVGCSFFSLLLHFQRYRFNESLNSICRVLSEYLESILIHNVWRFGNRPCRRDKQWSSQIHQRAWKIKLFNLPHFCQLVVRLEPRELLSFRWQWRSISVVDDLIRNNWVVVKLRSLVWFSLMDDIHQPTSLSYLWNDTFFLLHLIHALDPLEASLLFIHE